MGFVVIFEVVVVIFEAVVAIFEAVVINFNLGCCKKIEFVVITTFINTRDLKNLANQLETG